MLTREQDNAYSRKMPLQASHGVQWSGPQPSCRKRVASHRCHPSCAWDCCLWLRLASRTHHKLAVVASHAEEDVSVGMHLWPPSGCCWWWDSRQGEIRRLVMFQEEISRRHSPPLPHLDARVLLSVHLWNLQLQSSFLARIVPEGGYCLSKREESALFLNFNKVKEKASNEQKKGWELVLCVCVCGTFISQ